MSLDRRRNDEQRLKLKAEKIVKGRKFAPKHSSELDISPREIGKTYSTHGVTCSCAGCGNPRKHFNEKTLQEKKNTERADYMTDKYFGNHW